MSDEKDVDPRLVERLTRLRAEFIAQFGREPREDEPLIFDPASEVPTAFRHANLKPEIHAAMVAAAVPAHILYVYERTGLLLSKEAAAKAAPDTLDAYRTAMDEFAAVQYWKRKNQR